MHLTPAIFFKSNSFLVLLVETWSFDSSTRYSRKGNNSDEQNVSIVPIKFRKRIIQRVVFTITFFFIGFLFIQPWMMLRIAAKNSFDEVLVKRFIEISQSYNSTISHFLSRYLVAAKFMSGIMNDPEMIRCEMGYLSKYVRVANLAHNNLDPPPHYMYMWQKDKFCQIMWDNNSNDFRLSYLSQLTPDSYESILFRSEDDFQSPPEPTIVNSSMNLNFTSVKVAGWSTRTSFVDDGDPNSDLTALSPNVLDDNETFGVIGIAISIVTISDNLKLIQNSFDSKYVLLNRDNEVMIDDVGGNHLPIFINQTGYQHYVPISEFNSFWSYINAAGSLTNLTKIEINESEFMAIKIPLSPMGIDLFSLILVFSINQISQMQLLLGSVVFIAAFIIMGILYIVVLILLRRNSRNKKKKLSKITPKNQLLKYGIVPQYGKIGNAIQRLRNLQLRFPKKEMFNKVMDEAIANLAEQRKRRFSVALDETDCEFCKHLTIPPTINISSYVHRPAFKAWKPYRTSQFGFYKGLGELYFDWDAHINAPAKELLRLMVSIIEEEDLVFAEFDPDSLMLFMQHITTKCSKDNVRTAHELLCLKYLLSNFFQGWISNKIDRFILYMASFLYNTDSSVAFDAIEDDEFTQATEEVWTNRDNQGSDDDINTISSNNDEYDDDETNLKMYLTAFQDKQSAISRNVDFILSLLEIFVPTTSQSLQLVTYFKESLSEIMYDVQDSTQFELLGEFSSRVESSEFSVSSDPDDRLLFMKALIMLCHFCPYWSDVSTMVKATERLNFAVFGSNDNENIAEFHYEHATKIVAPWISIFVNFAPMDQVLENFYTNINYWKNKII